MERRCARRRHRTARLHRARFAYARRFTERLVESVERLSDFPRMGRRVPEADRDDVRELIFHAYRIIYLIEPEEITILTVVHGSRDLARRERPPWEVI